MVNLYNLRFFWTLNELNIDSSDTWHLTWNVVVTSTSSVNEQLWIWLCASYVTSGMFYATVNLSVSTLGHTLCNLSASITSPCYFLVDAVATLFSVIFFFVIHIITILWFLKFRVSKSAICFYANCIFGIHMFNFLGMIICTYVRMCACISTVPSSTISIHLWMMPGTDSSEETRTRPSGGLRNFKLEHPLPDKSQPWTFDLPLKHRRWGLL